MLLDWIKAAPKWVRAVVPLLLAVIAALYLCTSCGSISRVNYEKRMTRETKDTTRLIISAVQKTTVRAYGVPLVRRMARRSESVAFPLASEASIDAAQNCANSIDHSTAGSARRNIAKRSAVNSANDRAVYSSDRIFPELYVPEKENPASSPKLRRGDSGR